jgi:hypothetical protein
MTKVVVSKNTLQKQKPQLRETVLGSSPGEDGFSSSETKHDRKAAPGSKLFVSTIFQERRPNAEKCVLGSISGEDGFSKN